MNKQLLILALLHCDVHPGTGQYTANEKKEYIYTDDTLRVKFPLAARTTAPKRPAICFLT